MFPKNNANIIPPATALLCRMMNWISLVVLPYLSLLVWFCGRQKAHPKMYHSTQLQMSVGRSGHRPAYSSSPRVRHVVHVHGGNGP